MDIEHAYKMGQDCAKNGDNADNCNFAIFSTPENTKAWEQGKKDGDAEIIATEVDSVSTLVCGDCAISENHCIAAIQERVGD